MKLYIIRKIGMSEDNKTKLYEYNDKLLFTIKDVFSDWEDTNDNREVVFVCPQHRVPMVEEDYTFKNFFGFRLSCPLCERDSNYVPMKWEEQKYAVLQKKALALLDKSELENAKLIRLDDVYTREITKFDSLKGAVDSDYFIKADVKTDVNGDTIVVIYLGYKGNKDKAQLFIKPEKLQLSHDFKDMDPAAILAKVELTLRDRTITQNYDN